MWRKLFLLFAMPMAVLAADDASSIALSNTPAAVQSTINARLGGAKLDAISQSSDGDETVFDVSMTATNGDSRDFSVADDGTLLSVELILAETPAAVQKTIRTCATGGQLENIDENLADTEVTYDVTATKDGRENNFTVANDGDVVSAEISLTAAPAAVQAAIQARVADGQVEGVDEVFNPDGTAYEVEATTADGGRTSFTVAADGKLFSKQVTLEQVPATARKTIKEKIGDGRILRIEKSLVEKRDGVLPYHVQGRKAGRPFDFSVGPKGRFLGMDE